MKKLFLGSIGLMLVLMPLVNAESKEPKKDASDEETEKLERRKKLEDKKLEINGSEWQVQVTMQGGAKGTLGTEDILRFQDGRFTSKSSENRGYTATNYTLTVSDAETGPTVWETMQTNDKGEITFWRGEWIEKSMSGAINRQLGEEKGNEEYSFSSSAMKSIPPSSSEEKEEEVSAPAPPQVLTSTPAPVTGKASKQKKGGGFGGLWSSQ